MAKPVQIRRIPLVVRIRENCTNRTSMYESYTTIRTLSLHLYESYSCESYHSCTNRSFLRCTNRTHALAYFQLLIRFVPVRIVHWTCTNRTSCFVRIVSHFFSTIRTPSHCTNRTPNLTENIQVSTNRATPFALYESCNSIRTVRIVHSEKQIFATPRSSST